jgi:hypothetical protein
MPDFKAPILAQSVGGVKLPIETIFEAEPPLKAASNTAVAALTATADGPARAVAGTATGADALHGQSAGAGFSGVAGIHTAGGNGVYGSSKSGNAGAFDGKVQVNGNLTVSGDVFLPGADCAELFAVTSDTASVLPGTLLVIDSEGELAPSSRAYDRRVAGVVAGAGSYRPGIVLDSEQALRGPSARVSLIGKAFCQVDAGYGPIEVGDLLTTSDTVGCAMKASDRDRAFGAVVGKALRPLQSGRALLPILLTLQ